jgi:shikimate dehydrogenase
LETSSSWLAVRSGSSQPIVLVGSLFDVCSSLQPIVALLGHPVAGNPAQYMFEKAFVHHDLDWRYLSLEVAPDRLEDAVRGMRAMGFRGGHCADPHKAAVGKLLSRLGRSAEVSGAVTCIHREGDELVGENTAGLAVLESLRLRTDPAGKQVMLFGAGPMGRVIALELAATGAGPFQVVDRDESRATSLVELLTTACQASASMLPWQDRQAVPAEVAFVINATGIGNGDPDEEFPLDLDTLPPGLLVADVATNPPETWLLRHCEERGLSTIDGLEIFVAQAAIDFKLWTGLAPERTVMREAVEEFLEL